MILPMEATGILGSIAGVAELAKAALGDDSTTSSKSPWSTDSKDGA